MKDNKNMSEVDNEKKTNKKVLRIGVIFILLVIVTFYLFYGNNIKDILKICFNVSIGYIFIGIICMTFFAICEGLNIRRTLNLLGDKVSILSSFKYALVGFFFSSITPSSSGGQPAQIYFMKKDKLSMAHSTLSLLIELSSFQFITIILAIIRLYL